MRFPPSRRSDAPAHACPLRRAVRQRTCPPSPFRRAVRQRTDASAQGPIPSESKGSVAQPRRAERRTTAHLLKRHASRYQSMDILLIVIILLLLFGGGGGLYWGLGSGWGIGPIGLILLVIVAVYFMHGYRGRR